MDIRRAKEEVKNTVRAYLATDDNGMPVIPYIRQRPVFLVGPPGIGKTAIVKQAAAELGVGLAAYTMTHHTRQSAMGLPFIEKKEFAGEEYSVTSYTMSEIIASVYELIEKTGYKTGILFIDEINCVSETLAPVMLQFLQGKTFGNTKVPEGWVIVAAGNPPEYNRSVKEFDVVTLDRVKVINIEPDYNIWKGYAKENDVHQSILSYLSVQTEHFYKIETTIDGKKFVTARGWEDLSDMIKACERLNIPVDVQLIEQYIRHGEVAMDYANYLSLYYKYEKAYKVEDIFSGEDTSAMKERLKAAAFDERINVVSLIIGGLNTHFKEYVNMDGLVTELFEAVKMFNSQENAEFRDYLKDYKDSLFALKNAGQLELATVAVKERIIGCFDEWLVDVVDLGSHREQFEMLASKFTELNMNRERMADMVSHMLDNTFGFVKDVFGTGPEMTLFVTELATGYYSLNFIQEVGCDEFYYYNKTMLRDNARNSLLDELS